MKKQSQSLIQLIMILALLILLFAACTPTTNSVPGTMSPSNSPAISESSEESGPTVPAESVEPVEKFTGVWQYAYGDRNIAQIQVYNETENGFDFHLFVAEYDEDGKITQGGFSTNARKEPDGKAFYSTGEKESPNKLQHVEGTLAISNGYLSITYNDLQLRPYDQQKQTELPTSFKKVPAEKIKQAMYELPFFTREIIGFTLDLTIEKADILFGPAVDVEMVPETDGRIDVTMKRNYADTVVSFYYPEGAGKNDIFCSIETTRPDYSFIRGIKVGDSLESAIAKFPDERSKRKTVNNNKIQTLYGKAVYTEVAGYIWYDENGLKNIWYSDGGLIFKLEFDTTDHVSKMLLTSPID
ncbi:hypothetical protein [Dehalobacter sp. TBBPA1]|uniref:hypothetical protein n=1 Tax=Dehalobacter sp. TBBPA1 TaxID=3235037 RepID=UPI0034A43370